MAKRRVVYVRCYPGYEFRFVKVKTGRKTHLAHDWMPYSVCGRVMEERLALEHEVLEADVCLKCLWSRRGKEFTYETS